MRIRHLLIAGIALAFGLVVIRLVLLEAHVREGQRLDQFQLNVERISRDAAGLAVLSQDVILHNGKGSARRWRAVHSSLMRTLPAVSGLTPDFEADVDAIHMVAAGLPGLFDAIEVTLNESDRIKAQPRLELLADHLASETRRISDGAFELVEQMGDLRRARDLENRRVTWATMMGFTVLVLSIAVVVSRRVLRPMAGLQETAQAVRSGALEARSGYRASDEFGGLSRDFDDMTEALHQNTTRLAAALRDNEALLSTIRLHAIVSVADRSGSIIEVNDNFCAVAGYSREELIGQNHRIVNSGVQDRAFWADMWSTISSGKPWRGEICILARDGSLHWLDSIIAPFVGADGTIEKYISIRTDVTGSKLAELQLRASEAALDRTGRLAGVGGWSIDLETGAVEWTDQTCRLFEKPTGYRPTLEEAYGYYAPEARPVIQKAVEVGMASGSGWDLELALTTPGGRDIWARVIGEVELADGKPRRLVGAFQDVTARRALEVALRQKNEVMSSILENLPCGLSVFDAGLNLVASNSEYRRLLDFPEALFETQAPRFEDFIRYDLRRADCAECDIEQIVQDSIERACSTSVPHPFACIRPGGVPVEVQGGPMPGGGFVTTYTDVSERRRGEALLQAAHARFEIAADSADIGVWEFDIAAGTLVWDDRMYRLYGCERSSALEPYALWANSLHPGDRDLTEAALRDAMVGSRDYEPEFRIVWPNGEVRHLKGSARVMRDGRGTALRMTGVNIDITERKRAEAELLSTTSLLRTVLDSASEVAIIATDPGLGITVFNAGAAQLLGYAGAELVGRATLIALHDPQQVQARGVDLSAQLGRTIEGAAVFTEPSTLHEPREWTYVRKDGSRVTVSLVMTSMKGDDGRVLGYLGIAQDVTRQKAYEESLREAMYAARKANLAKSQFLANMSHEIRTPMNAVIGLGFLMEQTRLDAQQKDYVDKINLASKSLLALINDILDLSKVEAGELTLERAPFNLRHLLKNLGDVMGVHADAKAIAFMIDAPHELPVGLEGDSTRLNQILTNLLANAIKFTDRGGVKLVVRQQAPLAGGLRLRFSVQDSGIGIEPEQQARLFEPFSQADASTTRRFGGTGLGLSIVKRLVTAMGGMVEFTSTPNLGSEFCVELEFGRSVPEELVPHSTVPPGQRALAGVRVLVVDDSHINLEVARRILELEGAMVTLACNGQEAFDKVQATPHAFDLVLMDVQMPVLDGYGATRRIRKELGLATLPILALTASAMTSERQLAAESGMDGLIAKPFDPRTLALGVRRHVRRDLEALVGRLDIPAEGVGQAATRWPVIEGIDSDDVKARLGGDVALFRSILGRWLDEFGDLAASTTEPAESALALQAMRMHKLIGGAGILGMRDVCSVAREFETACRTEDARCAARCAQRLALKLQALRSHAASFLSAGSKSDSEAPLGDVDVDGGAEQLVELGRLLRDRNLAAFDLFSAASVSLQRLLGKQSYEVVRDHIDKLQFEDAARALEVVTGP